MGIEGNETNITLSVIFYKHTGICCLLYTFDNSSYTEYVYHIK